MQMATEVFQRKAKRKTFLSCSSIRRMSSNFDWVLNGIFMHDCNGNSSIVTGRPMATGQRAIDESDESMYWRFFPPFRSSSSDRWNEFDCIAVAVICGLNRKWCKAIAWKTNYKCENLHCELKDIIIVMNINQVLICTFQRETPFHCSLALCK